MATEKLRIRTKNPDFWESRSAMQRLIACYAVPAPTTPKTDRASADVHNIDGLRNMLCVNSNSTLKSINARTETEIAAAVLDAFVRSKKAGQGDQTR